MTEKKWIIPPDRRATSPRSPRPATATTPTCGARPRSRADVHQLTATIEALRATWARPSSRSSSRAGADDVVQVTQVVAGEPAYVAELVALYHDLEARLTASPSNCSPKWAGDEAALRRAKYQFRSATR